MKISTGLNTNGTLDKTIERATELRDRGLRTLWASQITGPDTLTVLALVGRELPELDLGTAVVPIQPRHPAMLAAQARTVQDAMGGTLSLGIGLSHQVVVEGMWGLPFSRPATHMREYLEALSPMLRGESVDVHGELVTAVSRGPVGPRDVRTPQLLVAALGPVMLRTAALLADGTCLWMTGRETVRTHVAPTINDAAAAAGRPAPRIVCSLPVSVTSDPSGAAQRSNEAYAIYPTLPSYAAMMAREGASTPAELTLIGSKEQVRDQIGQLFDAGVTEFSGLPTGDAAEREASLDLLAELAQS